MCALYLWCLVAKWGFCLHRQSKQPLMTALSLSSTSSHDSDTQSDVPCDVSGAGAQLWLIAPNNVTRKIVCDYLTEVRPT